jgi:YgiT-type zinc finger domain-containing protein
MGKTTKETCSNCGAGAIVVRGDHKFTESGLSNVTLKNIALIRCSACGNDDPIIPRLAQLMRVLALAIIGKPHRLVGEEIRFLRKYTGKTLEEFSRYLKVDKTTLSKWENNDSPGEQSDQLIRFVTLQLGEGLREEAHAMMERLKATSHKVQKVPIRVREKKTTYEYEYAA